MILSETLPDMEKTITLRQLAGLVVREEIARNHLGRIRAAERASMAPSTLDRVIKGDERVGDITLRQVEGALGLPRRFLTMVIEGDEQKLRELEMDADLRINVLSDMADIKNASSDDEKPRRSRRHG